MNKSVLTNMTALALSGAGFLLQQPVLQTMGVFALSGGLTNWLAIHMLFEKIPGLYGSGVIPENFQAFKSAIKDMIMAQFFTDENLKQWLEQELRPDELLAIEPVINEVDLSPIFDRLVEVIMSSSFAAMLSMLGGKEALMPLKAPFIEKMKAALVELVHSAEFNQRLQAAAEQGDLHRQLKEKVARLIDARLAQLTPEAVKTIIQAMIREHLGWLVVWGGVIGGVLGAVFAGARLLY